MDHHPLRNKIKDVLAAFSGATGICTRFLPAEGEVVEAGGCAFCGRLRGVPAGDIRCLRSMREAGRQAERLGEAYIAQCHAGLIEIACPLYIDERLAGTLHCGPLILWDKDEIAAQEILNNLRDIPADKHALFEDYFEIPVTDAERAQAVSELLQMAAAQFGKPAADAMQRRSEITRQQMKVADEIIKRKQQDESKRERSARLGVYPLNKERELLGRVRLGDRSGARRILNELLALIFYDTAGNMDIMKARVLELIVVISRAAVEGGAQLGQLLGADYNYLSELDAQQSFEEICAWVVRMLDAFIDAVYSTRNVKSSRYLGSVIEYIQAHYAESISLDDVAARVPISPYYLSHLFREELGLTFLEYVTKVRIEAAKRLLAEGDLRIRDVALMVGYDDAGYFSKVFRKMVGLPPNGYRKGQR